MNLSQSKNIFIHLYTSHFLSIYEAYLHGPVAAMAPSMPHGIPWRQEHGFKFDHVLGDAANQLVVFEQLGKPQVEKVRIRSVGCGISGMGSATVI